MAFQHLYIIKSTLIHTVFIVFTLPLQLPFDSDGEHDDVGDCKYVGIVTELQRI